MSILHVVAMITCTSLGVCTPHPLEREVYKSLNDCEDRAAHLEKINPGRVFECGTVYREDTDASTNRRTGTRTDDRSPFVVDRYRF